MVMAYRPSTSGIDVDQEIARQRAFDDPGIAAALVIAVAGEQAHALAVARHDQTGSRRT
jgi:hypothetical protein